ncbi:unnamed protein product, partial [Mesorhabditis belari]|uniref:Uncharacterized protein n=1 Tax=Mesorhabditis belari TaxID=2138241 RepID=A0AAF3EGK3_9BILA
MTSLLATLLIFIRLTTTLAQFYCADQVQRCAVAIEDYEKDIMQIKDSAFQHCFKRPACLEERQAYNRCFRESLRAVRAPFNGDLETFDQFAEIANRYRASLDGCFLKSPSTPMRSEFGPVIVDEDAVYARAIYSTEFTERLWGLSETNQPSLDTRGVCLVKNFALRVFGSGINRLVGSADPKLNNIASSCNVDEYEFLQLIAQRDYVLRQCVQAIRVQTPCRLQDQSRLRACICGAREEFEKQMLQTMLTCVSREGPSIPSRGEPLPSLETYPRRAPTIKKEIDHISSGLSTSFSPYFMNAGSKASLKNEAMEIRQGEIINGQCLCACNKEKNLLVKKREEPPQNRVFEQPDEFLMDRELAEQNKEEEDYPFVYGSQTDEKPASFPVLKDTNKT